MSVASKQASKQATTTKVQEGHETMKLKQLLIKLCEVALVLISFALLILVWDILEPNN